MPAGPGRPLAVVTADDAGALPDLSQSWAWAHAQILGAPAAPATDFDAAAVAALLAQAPARLAARVLCPRQLHPRTSYHAYLVPTFERGRLSGLGQSPGDADRLAPAWQAGQRSIRCPSTSAGASAPARLATSHRSSPSCTRSASCRRRSGAGELAVSPPGAAPPQWLLVDLECALIPLDTAITRLAVDRQHGFTAALAERTNAGGAVLAPPLYGRWLAAANALSTDPTAVPPWFHQLNGDPRARIAAGLGTVVVQAEQEQLLAGAWAQVDGVRAANERLRLAQLARELARRLYVRHISAVDEQSGLEVTAPLHGRVRVGAATAGAQLAATAIADGALAPTWRRVARPLGTLGVRQGRPAAPTAAPEQGSLARMNTGALVIAPGPPAAPAASPAGAARRLGDLSAAFTAAHVAPEKLSTIQAPGGFVLKPPPIFAPVVAVEGPPGPAQPPVHAPAQPPTHAPVQPPTHSAVQPPVHGPVEPPVHGPVEPPAHPPGLPPPAVLAKGFLDAASALMVQLGRAPAAGTTWIQADLDATRGAIAATLDPVATIQAPLAQPAERRPRRPTPDGPDRAGDGGARVPPADVRRARRPRARMAAARPRRDAV